MMVVMTMMMMLMMVESHLGVVQCVWNIGQRREQSAAGPERRHHHHHHHHQHHHHHHHHHIRPHYDVEVDGDCTDKSLTKFFGGQKLFRNRTLHLQMPLTRVVEKR